METKKTIIRSLWQAEFLLQIKIVWKTCPFPCDQMRSFIWIICYLRLNTINTFESLLAFIDFIDCKTFRMHHHSFGFEFAYAIYVITKKNILINHLIQKEIVHGILHWKIELKSWDQIIYELKHSVDFQDKKKDRFSSQLNVNCCLFSINSQMDVFWYMK